MSFAFASHNASRYFPFLEKPDEYFTNKKSFLYPAFFITAASTALGRDGGNAGIPELWGRYNLKSVITGLDAMQKASGQGAYNPFSQEVGYSDWNTKDLRFRIDGKVKSRGVILQWEQHLMQGFSLGVFVPIMHTNTSLQFRFDSANSHFDARDVSRPEEEMLDRVRRKVHCDLGLKGGNWTQAGFGDVDLHARWNYAIDHPWKLRTIHLMAQTGGVIPTGVKADKDYPSSTPFMGNGHWCAYGDLGVELELKQDWHLGFITGIMNQFSKTDKRRIPYHDEPPLFSALVGDVDIDPGLTLKISSYFTLKNVMDGLDFQIRHTYLRHEEDSWCDKRENKCVTSYLESKRSGVDCVKTTNDRLSSWRSHYLTMQLAYDSVEGMKNWIFEPKIYALLDYAFSGKGISKTHQFTVGVELHPW